MAKRMNFACLSMLLIVCSSAGGCGQGQTSKAPQPADQSSTAAAATQPASEVYREVTAEDGIKFYSKTRKETYQFDALHEEGYECGVIGTDGKKIEIALVSTSVDRGRVETRDFGVLMIDVPNKLLATESQIKKLRALQSSGQ